MFWLRKLVLKNLRVVPNTEKYVTINCDNMLTIAQAKDLKYYEVVKHIEIRHSLGEELNEKEIELEYTPRI